MTEPNLAPLTTPSGTGARGVLRIVLGVLTVVLIAAGQVLPFLVVSLGEGRLAPVSALDVVFRPAVLEDDGPQSQAIRIGFIGLLVVLVLLAIVLLVACAGRIPLALRALGLVLGVLGALGSLVVIALTGLGMRNVSAAPGAGGALLLLGSIAAMVLIGGAGRRRR
jgi:hypothetical protein